VKLDNITTCMHTDWTMDRIALSTETTTPPAALALLGLALLLTVILILPL
jgi:hypothetical protein